MRTSLQSFSATFIGIFPVTSLADDPLIFDIPVARQGPL
jgi:hypothetical protein